jgi:hypothetical protein
MAFIDAKYCSRCEIVTFHTNGECSPCKKRYNDERIAQWDSLTVDERLADLRERVEKLEHGSNHPTIY